MRAPACPWAGLLLLAAVVAGAAARNASEPAASTCQESGFLGTHLSSDGCMAQEEAAWVTAAEGLLVSDVPSSTACCFQCRTAPGFVPLGEFKGSVCIWTYCPKNTPAGSCADGQGGDLAPGDCRLQPRASLPLQPLPAPAPGTPRPTTRSGTPVESSVALHAASDPPTGFVRMGCVGFYPPNLATFQGPCVARDVAGVRAAVSDPRCTHNGTVAGAAAACRALLGCAGFSYLPVNGPLIKLAVTTSFEVAAAVVPEFTTYTGTAFFKYGAVDVRCATVNPYTFLFLRSDVAQQAGVAGLREGGDGAAPGGLPVGAAVGVAAAGLALAASAVVVGMAAWRRRRGGEGPAGGHGGAGGAAVKPGDRLLSYQSSLNRLIQEAKQARGDGGGSGDGGGGGPASTPGGGRARRLSDWEVDPRDVAVLQLPDGSDWLLGTGASGHVYKGLLNGVQEVAIKVFLDQDAGGDRAAAAKLHAALQREVAILRTLRDRNVVSFVGASMREGATVLLTEFCSRGDLYRALQRDGTGCVPPAGGNDDGAAAADPGGAPAGGAPTPPAATPRAPLPGRRFTWAPAYVTVGGGVKRRPGFGLNWSVALDVARGLHYLHSRGVCHLDVKSPNVLLAADWTAKLGDVGLAKLLRPDARLSTVREVGTYAWAAPEVLLGKAVNESADSYSFGVVLHELSTGEPPETRCMAPLADADAPPNVAAMVERCLSEDPAARPSALELALFFERGLARMDEDAGVQCASAPAGSEPLAGALERTARAGSASRSGSGADAGLPCGDGLADGGLPLRPSLGGRLSRPVLPSRPNEQPSRVSPPPAGAHEGSRAPTTVPPAAEPQAPSGVRAGAPSSPAPAHASATVPPSAYATSPPVAGGDGRPAPFSGDEAV